MGFGPSLQSALTKSAVEAISFDRCSVNESEISFFGAIGTDVKSVIAVMAMQAAATNQGSFVDGLGRAPPAIVEPTG